MNALNNDFNLLGADARAFLSREHGLRIGGRVVAASNGKQTAMIDPSSGLTVGHVPEASAAARGRRRNRDNMATRDNLQRVCHRFRMRQSFDRTGIVGP